METTQLTPDTPRQVSGWRTLLRWVIAFFAGAGSYLLLLRLLDVINQRWAPGTWLGDVTGYVLAALSHLGFAIVLFPLWVWFCYWVTKKVA